MYTTSPGAKRAITPTVVAIVKILSNLSEKDSLYETIMVATNDEFVKKFLDKKIKFVDLMNKIYKFINLDEFKKYKYIRPNKIEEIGIVGKKTFLEAGGKSFTLLPCLNSEPEWIRALQQIIRK